MQLMKEMETTGIPIVRSLSLEFDDPHLNIDDQFMLGSEILVAPILERDQFNRYVYFPWVKDLAYWEHIFTKEKVYVTLTDGRYEMIDCPLGSPAAFKKVIIN